MEQKEKISPFQLTCLLLLGRLYTVLIWSPKEAEAGSLLAATLISPVFQFLLIVGLMKLLDGLKKSGAGSAAHRLRHRLTHRLLQLAGLLYALGVTAFSAYSCGRFIAVSFYDRRYTGAITLLLVGGAAFAVLQGLEGIARAAPPAVMLTGVGLLLLGVGAAGTLRWDYLPPLTLTAGGTARLALQSGLMNFELAALIFLQPYATKRLKKSAIGVWLALIAVLSMGSTFTVMLTLGYYAQGQEYPVLAVARCARLALLERLDPVLMGVWVLLGLLKTAVFLLIAIRLWRQLFVKGLWAYGGWGRRLAAGALLVFFAAASSGCDSDSGIGNKTLVTLLEVEQGDGCRVRAEYRSVGSGEGSADYGVYTNRGESLGAALMALERQESVTLFLESCRMVTLVVPEGERMPENLLEELDQIAGIRPLTAVFLAEQPLLSPDGDEALSMGKSLEKLFKKNGGLLEDRYTLKDSIACERNPHLPLLLPVVIPNDRGDGAWLLEIREIEKQSEK